MFDSLGRFQRTFGRVGAGPGEYRLAQWTHFARGDTTIVVDIAQRRLSVLAPDGRYLQTILLPGYMRNVLAFGAGHFLANGTVGTPSSIGHPLHIVNLVGTVVASFGSDGPMRPGSALDVTRRMAVRGSSIWTAPVSAYRIDEWTHEGRKVRSLVRHVDWFQPYRDYPATRFDQSPPETSIRGVQVDEQGRLYVFMGVSDQNWRASEPTRGNRVAADSNRAGTAGSLGSVSLVEQERFYDTLIEVVDPSRGHVIFSQRFSETLLPMATPGWAYRLRDDQMLPVIEVYRLLLRTPSLEVR